MSIKNIANATKLPETFRWYVPNWNGDDPPFLELRPATTENASYTAARLQLEKSADHQRIARGGVNGLTVDKINKLRDADYPIFAKTVVVGWGGFFEDLPEGSPPGAKPAPFVFQQDNHARTEELLRALGPVNFDALREAARTPDRSQAGDLGKS